VEDVAQALARTAAHELGHILGLVGESRDQVCRWMDGCEEHHTCPTLVDRGYETKRFDYGRHIMDPGGESLHNARIAEQVASQRSKPRVPATFDSLSMYYLAATRPRGQR
jgi:hypothetical protein